MLRYRIKQDGQNIECTVGLSEPMPTSTRTAEERRKTVYISDTTSSIPADRKETLFTWAGHEQRARGTVPIIEDIATAHGWTVNLVDSYDGGARFEFTIVAYLTW